MTRFRPDGTSADYSTPAGVAKPQSIVTGPDGNLWFTNPSSGAIGQVDDRGRSSRHTP